MKNKSILILYVIIFLIGGVILQTPEEKKPNLKIALSISNEKFYNLKIDPANVNTLNEANLVRNLYIRLLEFDTNGQLILQAAESYRIEESTIKFKLRKDLKTSTGEVIAPLDFYKSFLRLLTLDKNTHGDLKNMICGSDEKLIMNTSCQGLSYDQEYFNIHVISKEMIPYILPLFANVDFSVIPTSAINWASKNLEILDYSNTSGAYSVVTDKTTENDSIYLGVNQHSILINKNSPEIIEIISSDQDNAIKMFLDKSIDFLPSAYPWDNSHLKSLTNKNQIKIHQTLPIKLWALRFTEVGRKRINSEARLKIGSEFRKRFNDIYKDEVITNSVQMFPKLSEGSLTAEQEGKIIDHYNKISNSNHTDEFTIGIPYGELALFKNGLVNLKNAKFIELKQAPWSLPIESQPDCYLTFGDSSYFEDISMISNQFNMDSFYLPKEDSKKWIKKYLSYENKSDRLFMLRELHFESLKSANIVPIGFTPFIAAIQNGWKMNFSKYYVGNPYWKIQWSN